jgi:hypothetical protein
MHTNRWITAICPGSFRLDEVKLICLNNAVLDYWILDWVELMSPKPKIR